MKTTILTLATLLMVACGVTQKNNNDNIDETLPIEQIDKELSELLHAVEENKAEYGIGDFVKTFDNRLKHYLRYPQTFENDMPLLKQQMHISEFPNTGHKKYSFEWYEGGTMGYCSNTYIQYRNDDGEVDFVPYQNDLRYPTSFSLTDFCHNGTAYYLVIRYERGSSSIWSYYVAVISIEDGKIVYHPEFFPPEFNFKPGTEEYFIYDENGDIIDNSERPSYFMYVCGTQTCNTNVDCDFDPKTLTVKVKDDADWTESRTGAVIEREWRLNIPE